MNTTNYTADTLRTAVLRDRPEGHRPPIDLLEMERELDRLDLDREIDEALERTFPEEA